MSSTLYCLHCIFVFVYHISVLPFLVELWMLYIEVPHLWGFPSFPLNSPTSETSKVGNITFYFLFIYLFLVWAPGIPHQFLGAIIQKGSFPTSGKAQKNWDIAFPAAAHFMFHSPNEALNLHLPCNINLSCYYSMISIGYITVSVICILSGIQSVRDTGSKYCKYCVESLAFRHELVCINYTFYISGTQSSSNYKVQT